MKQQERRPSSEDRAPAPAESIAAAGDALAAWLNAAPTEAEVHENAQIKELAEGAVCFATVATHRVLRPFSSYGRNLKSGDMVDATDWVHREILERDGSLLAIPHDPKGALQGAAGRARRRRALLAAQRASCERRLAAAHEELPALQACVDAIARLAVLGEQARSRVRRLQGEVVSIEQTLAEELPREIRAAENAEKDANRSLGQFPQDVA